MAAGGARPGEGLSGAPAPGETHLGGGPKEGTERQVERTTGVKTVNLKIVPQVGTGTQSLMHSLFHSSFQDFFLQHVVNMPGPGSDPKE